MDKAKAAITDFMGKSGHHDTTVHEAVAPAVQHEVVKPHLHEEVNTAVDKEVHQDHYHRTVQPVQDRDVLPEEHSAKLGGVQHREFDHRDHDATKRNLVQEQAQFADERKTDDTTHSQSVAPTVGGEHVHHHIHETIQPVVQKETIQPNVVHPTVPVHEVHHNTATHHDTTALPAMTMEQFKAKGGALTGREERFDEFEGVPQNIGGAAGGVGASRGLEQKTGSHSHEHARHGDYDGTSNPLDRNNDGKVDAHDLTGNRSHTDSHDLQDPARNRNDGATGTKDPQGHVVGSTDQGHMEHRPNEDGSLPKALTEPKSKAVPHSEAQEEALSQHHDNDNNKDQEGQQETGSSQYEKPSMKDKLNPKVDADGDGKAGVMN